MRAISAGGQLACDLAFCFAVDVHLKCQSDGGGFFFVDRKAAVDDLVGIRQVAAGRESRQGSLLHALGDDAGQLARIALCHCLVYALKDNALVAGADALLGGEDAHAGALELLFVDRGVVAVAGEAVEAVDDDKGKLAFFRVGDHALKLGAVIVGAGHGAVDILADHAEALLLAVRLVRAELEFYTVFGLPLGRKPRVYHGVQLIFTRHGDGL